METLNELRIEWEKMKNPKIREASEKELVLKKFQPHTQKQTITPKEVYHK